MEQFSLLKTSEGADTETRGARQEAPPAARDITAPTVQRTKPPEAGKGHSCPTGQTHTRAPARQSSPKRTEALLLPQCSSVPSSEQSFTEGPAQKSPRNKKQRAPAWRETLVCSLWYKGCAASTAPEGLIWGDFVIFVRPALRYLSCILCLFCAEQLHTGSQQACKELWVSPQSITATLPQASPAPALMSAALG